MLENEKDWLALPPELIQIIAKKLPDLLDFIRFRATCKTWRSSAPLSDPPPQLPWFIELLDKEYEPNYGILRERHRFYSISSCQTLTIPFDQSETLRKWIKAGVFSHYLPFASLVHDTLSFFNPLTKVQFSLPSACFYRYNIWMISVQLNEGMTLIFSQKQKKNTWMIWTGTDSICDRTIVIVDRDFSHKNEIGGWSCYDPHSNEWVEQEGYFNNSCYWQGMIFSTDAASTTKVFDASTKKLLHKIPPPKDDLTYLLEKSYLVVSLGIILRVSWIYDWPEGIVEESTFYIYRLEFDGIDGQPCWVKVHNIGNQILFLEEMTGFSMTARPSIGFREGCIYFIDPDDNKPYVHDILAGTVERVPCPFKRCTWFLPGLF